ncbi:MAG: hypothetical protein LBE36_06420 [Flavobacteriaceae bacterium]|jgi:predicted site-specific integrase-resolvase|nr:hypothetical protein [Flavobacteriaceae bacterium]
MSNKKEISDALTPEEIEAKYAELDAMQAQLDEHQAAIDAEIAAQEEKSAELADLAAALEQKEKDLEEREAAVLTAEAKTSEVKKPEPGKKFTFEGVEYKFKDSSPKKIRVNGSVKTQAQLVKDEDALLQLVGGNSGLIEKI